MGRFQSGVPTRRSVPSERPSAPPTAAVDSAHGRDPVDRAPATGPYRCPFAEGNLARPRATRNARPRGVTGAATAAVELAHEGDTVALLRATSLGQERPVHPPQRRAWSRHSGIVGRLHGNPTRPSERTRPRALASDGLPRQRRGCRGASPPTGGPPPSSDRDSGRRGSKGSSAPFCPKCFFRRKKRYWVNIFFLAHFSALKTAYTQQMKFAFVSCRPIRNNADLVRAASHALGRDASSKERRRKGTTGPRTRGIIRNHRTKKGEWLDQTIYPPDHPKGSGTSLPPVVNYPSAFNAHLRRNQAAVPGNAHSGLHLIVGVSKEYFDDEDCGRRPGDRGYKGSRHDPHAPAVRKLLKEAASWADNELGGVWAARYDVDEAGSSIVDVFCSPIRENKASGKKWVSIRKPQRELKQKYPYAARGYGAMQSSWADYATKALGEHFERGIPKKVTKREHLIAREYGEAMDAGRERVASIERKAEAGKKRLLEIEDQLMRAAEALKAMIAKQKTLMAAITRLQAERERIEKGVKKTAKAMRSLRDRLGSWALSRYRAASRPTLPPDPEHAELADDAIGLAAILSSAADESDPPAPVVRHKEAIEKKIRAGRREQGWGEDHSEAPLHTAWAAEMKGKHASERLDYQAWRLELAHSSGRGVKGSRRDLIGLARRVEKETGRYVTRAERRRRSQKEKAARALSAATVVESLAEEVAAERPNRLRPRRR